jgi:hypothetical protein
MTCANDLPVIRPGQTFRLALAFKDSEGVAVDLTGAAIEGRLVLPSGAVTYPATVDAAAGSVVVTVDRTATAEWPAGRYEMQIWADYGEGAAIEESPEYIHVFSVQA